MGYDNKNIKTRIITNTVTAENTVYFIIMRKFQIDNLHTE